MNDPRAITLNLHGRWRGRFEMAPCPVCQPERRKGQNALSISEKGGKLMLHCKKSRCAFRDLLKAVGVDPCRLTRSDALQEAQWRAEEEAEASKRARQARRVWDDTVPIRGTLGETYLRSRGISCPLPTSLRFAPSCWYDRERSLPAMVALVEGGGGFAIHRTYLQPDGSGKAEVDDPKKMLGPVMGGAVRLVGPPRGTVWPLVVAEGIETALSLASGLIREPATVWAALSASGIAGLRLPPEPGRLKVAADGDAAGRREAESLAKRARSLGWQAEVRSAPDGWDWNDVLRTKAREAAA